MPGVEANGVLLHHDIQERLQAAQFGLPGRRRQWTRTLERKREQPSPRAAAAFFFDRSLGLTFGATGVA